MPEEKKDKEAISTKLTGALWDRIKDFFTMMWDEVFNALANTAFVLVKKFYDAWNETMIEMGDTEFEKVMKEPIRTIEDFKRSRDMINQIKAKPSAMNAFKAFFLEMTCAVKLIMTEGSVINAKLLKELNKEYAPSPIDLGFLINLWYKNPELRPVITEKATENGFTEEDVKRIFESARTLLHPDEVRELYLRDDITVEEKNKFLYANGFKGEDIELLTKLYKVIPPINDLVRMAVREAFTPEIVSQYQLHSDLPQEFIQWGKTKGLDEYWTKAYWAAHWELPSLTMAFEMYHRGVITYDEIMLLMRTQDIMPFWRDKILKISHNPYTRVDVRRMYAAGVLDREAVFTSYKDVGYDDEKAEKMTEFTVRYTQEKERDLTKSEIIDGYKKGIISEGDAGYLLRQMGYDESESEFYLVRAQYDVSQKRKKLSLTNIKRFYIKGILSFNECLSKLGALNLPSNEINLLIQEWDIEKEGKSRLFPLAELHKLFKLRKLPIDVYRTELSNMGFSDKYINWFVQLYGGK